MRYCKTVLFFLLLLLFLSGCATYIYVKVLKPAEVNMSGARKIAVFTTTFPKGAYTRKEDILRDSILQIKKGSSERLSDMYELAEFATDNLVSNLSSADYFEIISPTDVERALEYYEAETIDPIMLGSLLGAEAIILSEMTDLRKDKSKYIVEEVRVDEKTEEEYIVEIPWIRVTASIRFTYWVISTSTDKLIAAKTFEKSNSHSVKAENSSSIKSFKQLFREILQANLGYVARQLAPYEVMERRVMMKDKTDDPRMEQADNYVTGNIYDNALDIFLEVWYDNQNPAAGVNGAIMHEVLGDIDSALKLIEEVIDVNAESKVMDEYNRLKRVKEDLLRLEEQMGP